MFKDILITIGKDESAGSTGAVMTEHQFHVVSLMVREQIKGNEISFHLLNQLMLNPHVKFDGLDAFLILEELSSMIEEPDLEGIKDYLVSIYNALKICAYSLNEKVVA